MKLFSYWTGEMPAYINLCKKSIERFNRLHMLDKNDFDARIVDDGYFDKLKPAHQTDVLRAMMLATSGGGWIDLDFICFRSMQFLLDQAEKSDSFFYYDQGDGPTNGFLAAGPENIMAQEFAAKVEAVYINHRRMGTDPATIPWTAFGQAQLRAIMDRPLCRMRDVGQTRLAPIKWGDHSKFFGQPVGKRETRNAIWTGDYGYMLYNNSFPTWFKSLTEDQVLNGKWFISALFRVALGLEE